MTGTDRAAALSAQAENLFELDSAFWRACHRYQKATKLPFNIASTLPHCPIIQPHPERHFVSSAS